jgi:hypothetical protein
MTFVCAIILYFGLKRENARRDAKYGAIVSPDTDSSTASLEQTGGEKMLNGRARATTWQEDLEDREYLERWSLTGMSKEEIIDLGDDHPSFRFMY